MSKRKERKKKNLQVLEMSFSCFKPFGVWGVTQWLSACMLRNDLGPHENDSYLQTLCTTLWSLWNHRNKVFHEGINPNPMMVILTFQSLVCRFQEAFRTDDYHSQEHDRPALTSATTRNWQLIVKLVGCKRRKCNRSGYAYEANDLKGDQIFSGAAKMQLWKQL